MTNHPAPSSRRRTTSACCLLGLIGAGVVAATVPAAAHVTVQPGRVEGGGFAVVSFRVPNEREDASTTRVRVILPSDRPLGSVQTTPVPGWRVTTRERELDEPLELFGSTISAVVSEVTWTAAAAGVRPGQFQDFPVSLGQLPESGELTFKAVQTYSSGERVTWNEVAVDDSAEPEHPAPVLVVTPPEEAAEPEVEPEPEPAAPPADSGPGAAWPIGISVVALLTALVALGAGLKRRTG